MKNIFSTEKMTNWLFPYPMGFHKKHKWNFVLVEISKILKWKNPNELPNLGRVSFEYIAKNKPEELDYPKIERLLKEWVCHATGFIVVASKHKKDGYIVWDGSNRLTALVLDYLSKKRRNKMQYIGVILLVEKK